MSLHALGVYLEEVRNGRNISQQQMADALGISVRTIRSMEHGTRPSTSEHLFLVLEYINGSASHVDRLIRGGNEALARSLAAAQLRGEALTRQEVDRLESMPPDRLRDILDFAERMLSRS